MSGGRSERCENTIIQVHQCLSQRKTKIQKEKDVVSGSPILKTNDGRRCSLRREPKEPFSVPSTTLHTSQSALQNFIGNCFLTPTLSKN
ncbi:hypothetical protein RUM44_012311 [Polyplax serrata]|uniref:Uncharacterized protein n=1 Tax=Polyplax serrata TaxID=468196 RepID=A0ABR1BD25_POLSC